MSIIIPTKALKIGNGINLAEEYVLLVTANY
jgi:hypothetical protein